jgi:hypothetical protein
MSDKDTALGYMAGVIVALIGMAASMSRDDTISSFKVPKETKRTLRRVAKSHGWSLAEACYYALSIGTEVLAKGEEKREKLPL